MSVKVISLLLHSLSSLKQRIAAVSSSSKSVVNLSKISVTLAKSSFLGADTDADIETNVDAVLIDNESSELPSTNSDESWADYLSTHPNTQQRILRAQRYAVCFREGVLDCVTGRREVDWRELWVVALRQTNAFTPGVKKRPSSLCVLGIAF